LRWVVEFARKDLSLARPEELVALGYDLRALPPPVGTLTRSPHKPLPGAEVMRIHAEVKKGLQQVLSRDPKGGWILPPPKSQRLVRIAGVFTMVQETEYEVDSIAQAIGLLIARAGQGNLRSCPECGRPFMRTGRRLFCEERCSMRVRNRNRSQ
jgi:hypothetical protein